MSSTDVPELEFIDTPEDLAAFCDAVADVEWITVDTEFIREKTYYPRLCLVQLGVPGRAACIDTLAIDTLEPLFGLLLDKGITKVLHACSQDLEIFVHLTGQVPAPIFDTQLAAPLLGLQEQIGYGNAVKEVLGIQLEKGQARTDWSRRPLSRAQLEYAADDVRYLTRMYPQIRETLESAGRLDWLQPEFAVYEDPGRYQPAVDQAWRRLRGVEKLKPAALSTAQALATWRETRARERDLPRNWVLKDDVIMDISRILPGSRSDLEVIRGLPPKTLDRYGDTLLELVREARSTQPQPLPERKRSVKPTVQEEAQTDILQAHLRLLADEQGINSVAVGSRKDLLALVRNEDSKLLQGWRLKLAGEELRATCDGQRRVSIENARVTFRK